MPTTLSHPPMVKHGFRRAAILFAGGPAPAANAVISAAVISFLRNDIEVYGIMHGYSHLLEYSRKNPMVEDRDYIDFSHEKLKRARYAQGIMIGTSRANPGKEVSSVDHLDDRNRTAPLRTVYNALCSLGIDALVSIGGDDTLKTANKLKLFQDRLPKRRRRIPIVHLPKTIHVLPQNANHSSKTTIQASLDPHTLAAKS